jgi:ABC-2 type transport system ATP-binding protein
MIRIENLHKQFGPRVAVEDLSLQVEEGALYGLLGHNGAGKSTTIGMMLGQVIADRGRVLIGGHDVQRERALALRQVGAIFETPSFYGYLSGRKNLEIFCNYSCVVSTAQINEVVELVQALLPRPRVLILDEPSEGLDPEGIYEMRELIRQLHRDFQLTVLICSHLLAEVEQICPQVAIMRKGRLLFHGDWRSSQPPGRTLEQFYLETVKGIEV